MTERLRPRPRTFRAEHGNELFDLPDAPRPDSPAPLRFLPEYDNVLLFHADRSRIIVDDHRPPLFAGNGGGLGTVLVDGFFRGIWKTERTPRGKTMLVIEPFEPLPKEERDALVEEGWRLVRVVGEGAEAFEIRFVEPWRTHGTSQQRRLRLEASSLPARRTSRRRLFRTRRLSRIEEDTGKAEHEAGATTILRKTWLRADPAVRRPQGFRGGAYRAGSSFLLRLPD